MEQNVTSACCLNQRIKMVLVMKWQERQGGWIEEGSVTIAMQTRMLHGD